MGVWVQAGKNEQHNKYSYTFQLVDVTVFLYLNVKPVIITTGVTSKHGTLVMVEKNTDPVIVFPDGTPW